MTNNRNLFSRLLDPLLFRLFSVIPDEEERYTALRKQLKNKEHFLYDMNIIDSKSSALLTHVSIMLAVVVVLISLAPGKIWEVIMTLELIAFTIVGMLLLRCVDVMGPPYKMPPEDPEEATEMYQKEILLRRGIYQTMVRVVFVLTIILISLVVIKTVFLFS